ncbi:MAG: hypothetical protein SFY68_13005 [Candidatus Sumerlaeia bacterium]|nr:hypothetical protein [Candidatus Sumerlaeia bacterium]
MGITIPILLVIAIIVLPIVGFLAGVVYVSIWVETVFINAYNSLAKKIGLPQYVPTEDNSSTWTEAD